MARIQKIEWASAKGRGVGYRVVYRDAAGKERTKQFKLRKEAQAFADRVQAEVDAGTHTPGRSITVADAADIWLQACQAGRQGRQPVDAHTYRAYESHVRLHIKPRIGGRRLAELTGPVVAAFRDELVREMSSRAMAKAVLGSFKAILAEAKARGLVGVNAADGISVAVRSGRHQERVEIPSKDEVRAILRATDALAEAKHKLIRQAWRRYRPLLYLLVDTCSPTTQRSGAAGERRLRGSYDRRGVLSASPAPVKTV